MTVVPPHASGTRPSSASSRLTLSGFVARLVDLVDRDDDRDVRGTRVIDRLARLRHHAIIGRDDEHDDVGHLRAARAHHRERLVARRVEEHDVAAVADRHVIRADVLRDAAGLALGDPRGADRVEQRRLAVIDVAHDGDDRRARDEVLGLDVLGLDLQQLLLERAHLDVCAELARDHHGGLGVERAVDVQHHALHQQLGEHVLDAQIELVREILDRHALCQCDRA